MTTTQFFETRSPGWLQALATAQHDPNAAKPWVVLAWTRSAHAERGTAIVAGYNRWTGEVISWLTRGYAHDDRYDLSQAVETTK